MIATVREWSDDAQALIESLALLPAVQRLDTLPDRLGIPAEELELILGEARAAELVTDWPDSPWGRCVMLSHRAAAYLELVLVARRHRKWKTAKSTAELRWVHRSRVPNDHVVLPPRVFAAIDLWDAETARTWGFDTQVDPRPIDPLASARADDLPPWFGTVRPRLLLGITSLAWYAPAGPDGLCPVCEGARLRLIAYCLRCDRSGADGMLDTFVEPRLVRPSSVENRNLGGGIGPATPNPAGLRAMTPFPGPRRPKPPRKPATSGWRSQLDAMRRGPRQWPPGAR